MLVFRALFAALIVLPFLDAASLQQIPPVPLGFEKAGGSYMALGTSMALGTGGTILIHPSAAEVGGDGRHIRMDLIGAKSTATLEGSGDAGTRNEFLGSDTAKWRSGIKLSSRVTARGVYPGVDIAWYGSGSNLEYDFDLQPFADPHQIQLRISGAAHVDVTGSGDALITDSFGTLTQKSPLAYQTIRGARREVAARFRLANQTTLALDLSSYDESVPLTIDPALQLSSYFGGNSADEAHAVAVDSAGNLYVAGVTYSTKIGNGSVFILKIPVSGAPVTTLFGGTTGADIANGMTVDSSGNVYVVGSTTSLDFPRIGLLAIQNQAFGQKKAFILGLGSNLSSIGYSAYFGGSYSDQANAIALGPNNVLYIVGDTTSVDFLEAANGGTLINSNAFQDSNHGSYDGFLISMSAAGVFNYATYIGGTAEDHAYAVAVDANNYVYVVGGTQSADFPGYPNSSLEAAVFKQYHGNQDAFVIKLTGTSDPLGSAGFWSIYIGGASQDVANGVALDSKGNAYITGTTASTDFPVGGGAFETTYQGGEFDGFVFALHSDGLHGFWSTFLGTSTADALNAIALDSNGNIYVTGTSDGTTYPVTSDAIQSSNAGGQDITLTELNVNGTAPLYSTYLGGTGNDVGRALAVDSHGNIYLAGITSSGTNFPLTASTYQSHFGGGTSDAFFSILGCPVGVPIISTGGVGNAASYSTATVSPGGIFAIFGSYFSCVASTASKVPLATTLNGVSVQLNGTAVPLFYAGEGQINAQLPYGTPAGAATITVKASGGTSTSSTVTVVEAGPGLFTVGTQAAALNADGTLNTPTNGAAAGSAISAYFTGTGPLNNAVADGTAAPSTPLSNATQPYSATVGGQAATVSFLGLAPGFVGLGQANITIPQLAAGDYPLIITINGVASNSAIISVSN